MQPQPPPQPPQPQPQPPPPQHEPYLLHALWRAIDATPCVFDTRGERFIVGGRAMRGVTRVVHERIDALVASVTGHEYRPATSLLTLRTAHGHASAAHDLTGRLLGTRVDTCVSEAVQAITNIVLSPSSSSSPPPPPPPPPPVSYTRVPTVFDAGVLPVTVLRTMHPMAVNAFRALEAAGIRPVASQCRVALPAIGIATALDLIGIDRVTNDLVLIELKINNDANYAESRLGAVGARPLKRKIRTDARVLAEFPREGATEIARAVVSTRTMYHAVLAITVMMVAHVIAAEAAAAAAAATAPLRTADIVRRMRAVVLRANTDGSTHVEPLDMSVARVVSRYFSQLTASSNAVHAHTLHGARQRHVSACASHVNALDVSADAMRTALDAAQRELDALRAAAAAAADVDAAAAAAKATTADAAGDDLVCDPPPPPPPSRRRRRTADQIERARAHRELIQRAALAVRSAHTQLRRVERARTQGHTKLARATIAAAKRA